MSGHSKWSTIKRQKGAADAKRGVVFTKLANAIAISVRQGGGVGDPAQNFKLRLAVEAARTQNMPKENIERAIQRATGKAGESKVDEAVYEGFAPGGVAVMVEAVTDNKNRTVSEIKNIFEKSGGTMGQSGTVAYNFKQVGQIVIDKSNKTLDEVFLEAADAGAEDIEEEGNEVYIFTSPHDLARVRDGLSAKKYLIKEIELIRKPVNLVAMSESSEQFGKVISLLDKLEALDDVQKVYANFELQ